LTLPSVLNLNIENVFAPASKLENSIGFQMANGAPLTGSMNIGLTNVTITPAGGVATALTSANAANLGESHQRIEREYCMCGCARRYDASFC
jgi:hypothetical protein